MRNFRISHWFMFGTIAVAGIMLALGIFWMLFPYNAITFGEGNGTIINKEVEAGEYLQMRQVYCKSGDYITTVSRSFVDGFIYTAPNVLGKRPNGCHDVIELIYVPKALNPGTYTISTNISYQPNPLRTITLNVTTEKFEVIE